MKARVQSNVSRYASRGRPSEMDRMIELAKMAWGPVLELLGRDITFENLARRPYPMVEPVEYPPDPGNGHHALRWLETRDVERIHDVMIRTFGGEPGVISTGTVSGTLDRMRRPEVGRYDPLPTIYEKAAFLLHSILNYHPFVDGQKRTGISAAFIFLGINGYHLWSRDPVDEVHFAIHVAAGEFEVPEIALWLRGRVVPRRLLSSPEVVRALLRYAEPRARRCTVCHKAKLIPDRYFVTCGQCGATFRVKLNAGLIRHTRGNRRPPSVVHVDLGMELVDPSVFTRPTRLEEYNDRAGTGTTPHQGRSP